MELKPLPTAEVLADAFSAALRDELHEGIIDTIVERNRTPEYAGCCASHDFCDANMVMDAAIEGILGHGLFEDPRLYDEEDGLTQEGTDLWNAAWDLAKEREFKQP